MDVTIFYFAIEHRGVGKGLSSFLFILTITWLRVTIINKARHYARLEIGVWT